jgi:hypothetical protein
MEQKKSTCFEPSGLDEVFADLAKRKAEAIANGWIITAVPPHDPEPEADVRPLDAKEVGGK